jgi:hypothetical protein
VLQANVILGCQGLMISGWGCSKRIKFSVSCSTHGSAARLLYMHGSLLCVVCCWLWLFSYAISLMSLAGGYGSPQPAAAAAAPFSVLCRVSGMGVV